MVERGVLPKELVELSEMSQSRIERLLEAEAEPTARDLLRLAGALDATVSEVLESSARESDDEGKDI